MKYTISVIALLSITSAAYAEGSNIPVLPTTVVTGDLWDSELQQTTASVTVLEQYALEGKGIQHFEDVINNIPNLTWTGGTSRPRYIQIRGIGENSQFEGETPDSTVRFLVDDLDYTGIGTVGNLFDVGQVEVLRGPQAGAFGANAAGGVVHIVTNDPTPFWTGQSEVTVGNDDLRAAGIAVGGPILKNDPEQLTFRLSAHQLVQNGFRDNAYFDKDDTNERDELTTRLKLRWLANEDWQIDGTVAYASFDNGYDEWSLNNTEFDTYSDEPGRDEQESLAGSIRASWTGLDKIDVTNIIGGTTTESLYSYDNDWGAGYVAEPFASGYLGFLQIDRERDVFSNELRLDSKDQEDALGFIDRWTVGLYYQSLEEDSLADYDDDFGTMDAASNYESESFALFAQAAHDITDQTRIILGLRVEQYDVETESFGTDSGDYDGRLSTGESSENGTLWGGKITLEHDLNDNHMLFASAARGYKAGGANVSTFSFDFDPKTYDDETLYNFEFGLRSSWANGSITTQITGFYLHRQDAQLRDSIGAGGFFRYLTVNGNDATHMGLEAEATWHIDEDWSISAGLGLLETTRDSYSALTSDESIDEDLDIDDINDPVAVHVDSRDLSNAPSYNFHLRVNYQPENGLFAQAEVTARDSYYESNSHNEKRSDFAIVNAAIGYRYENWTFTLWAKNLFDESYEKRIFNFDNFHPDDGYAPVDRRYENPADPQQFGVTANYSW
ncbi:TonB-dependent receptor [Puniceicoccaceae bacterium]|nr:TonB-dependent receptor [Puniceicoccaceae bacterium]